MRALEQLIDFENWNEKESLTFAARILKENETTEWEDCKWIMEDSWNLSDLLINRNDWEDEEREIVDKFVLSQAEKLYQVVQ